MFESTYNKNSHSHIVMVSGLGKKLILLKVDTGAAKTIISAKAIGLTAIQQEHLLIKCEECKTEKLKFLDATSHVFYGYLVKCNDIKINGYLFMEFYYYLTFIDEKIALLGDDFLDNCSYMKGLHSEININAFDVVGYNLINANFHQQILEVNYSHLA